MNLQLLTYTLLFFLLTACSPKDDVGKSESKPEETSATYEVRFTFDWNKNDFPTDYPTGTHFSPLVGWVHQENNDYFDVGKIASSGIEQMAEEGITTTLVNELQALIDTGLGLKTYTGNGLNDGVGTITLELTVTKDFPAVTLATMVAPSPDWYVACVAENLLTEDGFITERTITGIVYDAGTDNGVSFRSANSDTAPKEAISKITQPPLGDGTEVKASFCSITFTKK